MEPATHPLVLRPDHLAERAGATLGTSGWHAVTQEQVDLFARATGDHQWIHVDVERARRGPFARTIAHGYLTLALAPVLLDEVVRVEPVDAVINYGADRVRFPAPVPVGERVRAAVELRSSAAVAGGVQAEYRLTFDVEGSGKPACVADILFRYRFAAGDEAPA